MANRAFSTWRREISFLHLKKNNIPMAVATGSRRRNYLRKTSGPQVRSVFQYFDIEKNVITGDPIPEDPGRVAKGD